MPRYFFHVIDGVDIPDLEGTLLPGLAEARSQAIVTAGEILKSEGLRFWNGSEWRMKVTDDVGTSVLTLKFSADDHDADR
jgi:hypothetical protein